MERKIEGYQFIKCPHYVTEDEKVVFCKYGTKVFDTEAKKYGFVLQNCKSVEKCLKCSEKFENRDKPNEVKKGVSFLDKIIAVHLEQRRLSRNG